MFTQLTYLGVKRKPRKKWFREGNSIDMASVHVSLVVVQSTKLSGCLANEVMIASDVRRVLKKMQQEGYTMYAMLPV